jgi:hypothetical protein
MSFPFVIVCPVLKVSGMAIFPFILVKQKEFKHDTVLIQHETIHLWQELELLVIPFYILYLLNYLINLYRYRDHNKAYLNIVFEREAYTCEGDSNYLGQRRFWAWVKYIRFANNT